MGTDRETTQGNEPTWDDLALWAEMSWEQVESSRSDASWGVDDLRWDDLAPALPAEVAALLAAPVAVTAEPLADAEPEDEPERWPAPDEPCARRSTMASATYAACVPRFLAPSPPRPRSGRPGRHLRTP